MTLKIADNDNNIKDEIENGKFNLDLSDNILHLKSFIDKDMCVSVMNSLDKLENNKDMRESFGENVGVRRYRPLIFKSANKALW